MNNLAGVSSTSDGFGRRFQNSNASSSRSSGRYAPTPTDFIRSFYAVLRRWQSETAFLSDPDKITAHPSFQALVDNAQTVLPLIIAELRIRPSMLVWVLDDALNDTPYSQADVGDIVVMSNAWVGWAERNGRTI